MIDFHLVTKWKTAGDSLLGALRLARPDSERVLVVGAGTVARSLIDAYGAGFPGARFTVWSRTRASAEALAAERPGVAVADDLEAAVRAADIVACATMATEPLIRGDWLREGTHLDLIGAYRPDMREADDAALARARVFCDLAQDGRRDGRADDPHRLGRARRGARWWPTTTRRTAMARGSDREITLFKNGGGAHLDLMVSRHILDAWRGARRMRWLGAARGPVAAAFGDRPVGGLRARPRRDRLPGAGGRGAGRARRRDGGRGDARRGLGAGPRRRRPRRGAPGRSPTRTASGA